MKIYNLLPTNNSFLLTLPTLAKTAQDLIFSASTNHNRKIGLRDSSVCMYLISLEMLSSSAIRLVFMRGVYLANKQVYKNEEKTN